MKKIFWIFVLVSILVHIPAINFPLATLEDESFHIERAIYTTEILNTIPIWAFMLLIISLIISIYLLYKLYNKNNTLFLLSLIPLSSIYYYLVTYFATKFNISHFGVLDYHNLVWLVRYGSLGTLTYTIQLFTFGYREWAMRLFPLIFSILTSIYLYKLILLYKNERWAFFSAITFLFLPGIFYYVNISQLTTGILFFMISSIYFLCKFNLEKKEQYLIYMTIFLILGFQYKEIFILIYGIIIFYLIYLYIIKRMNRLGLIFKYLVLSLIPTIIWTVIQVNFNPNSLSHRFFSINLDLVYNLFRYIFLLPQEATIPITILFLLSIILAIYSIIKKKDELAFIFLIFFLIIYSFFTLDSLNNYFVVYRYGAYLLPAVAFFSFYILNLIKKENIIKWISYGLIVFLIITSSYVTYHNWENRFVPMDGTFSYIKENVSENAKILKTMAPNPYKFYIGKYDLKQEFKHEIWENASDQNITNLYDFMKINNYSYFIFPHPSISYHSYWPNNYSWVYTTTPAGREQILNEILLYQLESDNQYFEVVYNEKLGPNALYLVKIR